MLFHASGGLVYHLRAWRWRNTHWLPFRTQVAGWLDAWQPHSRHLLLIGPSGGYALSPAFLARFDRIEVLEPDSVARRILAWRFPQQQFDFVESAWLANDDGPQQLAQRYLDTVFLFCNLLGQTLAGQGAEHDRQAWLRDLEYALAGRDWASWHDLASTTRRPDRFGGLSLNQTETLDVLLAKFWFGGELEIHDHDCTGLLSSASRHYAIWQLAPRRFHLVEWVHSPTGNG